MENHWYVMEECYGLEALTILWFQLLQKIELHGVKIKIIKPPHRLIKKRPKSRTRWKINLSWFSRNVWSVTAVFAQCPFYPVVDVIKMFITLQADSLVAGYIWAEEMSPFCLFSWTLTAVVICGGVWRAGKAHGTVFPRFSLLSHMQGQLKIQSTLVKVLLWVSCSDYGKGQILGLYQQG